MNRIPCYALALAMLANGQYAYAETRRALLIGIDKYVSGKAASGQMGSTVMTPAASGRGDWSDLDGAVNDVDVLQQILTTARASSPTQSLHFFPILLGLVAFELYEHVRRTALPRAYQDLVGKSDDSSVHH